VLVQESWHADYRGEQSEISEAASSLISLTPDNGLSFTAGASSRSTAI
jgi:hypothetical protein